MWVFRDGVSFLAIEFFNHYTFAKAPNMKIKEIEISKVIPYARNPRNNVDAVAGKAMSRQDCWKLDNINRKTKMLIGGNAKRRSGFRTNVKTYSFKYIPNG